VPAPQFEKGDLVVCETGDIIPADGEVIEGIASVDEAAITGESAPVIRESGGDRSAVTGGTRVISDRIVIRITSEKGNTFIDRMIAMVEGAKRQKTPNEIALTILLSAMTLIFLLVVITLKPFGIYAGMDFSTSRAHRPARLSHSDHHRRTSQRHRHQRHRPPHPPQRHGHLGRAVEAAGDIDVLLLDKTGTITIGNRMARFPSRARRHRATTRRCRATRLARR
jgi:K+-transporting ATPase ATPase B chain